MESNITLNQVIPLADWNHPTVVRIVKLLGIDNTQASYPQSPTQWVNAHHVSLRGEKLHK